MKDMVAEGKFCFVFVGLEATPASAQGLSLPRSVVTPSGALGTRWGARDGTQGM